MHRQLPIAVVLILTLFAGGWLAPGTSEAQNLWVWQQRIDWQFKVDQLPPDRFVQMQDGQSEDFLILDVREADEFAVSHLAGAHQVAPNATPQDVLQRFSGQLSGRHVVLYCSIGWRSSELADQLQPYLESQGVAAVSNLRGGIFRWHNESRPLTNEAGATELVHPFGPDWAGLLDRQWLTACQP